MGLGKAHTGHCVRPGKLLAQPCSPGSPVQPPQGSDTGASLFQGANQPPETGRGAGMSRGCPQAQMRSGSRVGGMRQESASDLTSGAQYRVKMWDLLLQRTETIKVPTWATPGRVPPELGNGAPAPMAWDSQVGG